MISVDKTLFMNVIQNLVANAIIYCKEDELPVISISAKSADKKITIHIADNGIGIEEPFQDKVFEMFKRLKTKRVDGTGIGLASCKKIVEIHNGKIAVESTVGIGSTFSIQLPWHAAIPFDDKNQVPTPTVSLQPELMKSVLTKT